MPGGKGNIKPEDGKPFKKNDPRINRNGYPAGVPNISTVLREYLEIEDKKQGGTGNALNIPTANLIKLLTKAKNEAVQLKAIQEAFERLEGKVDEKIILNTVEMPKIIIERDTD